MNLYEHQVTGIAYLASRKRAYLGDPPGFGKTRIAVVAAYESNLYPLVVCPAIVRTHWQRELAAYFQYDVPVYSYDQIVRGGYTLMQELLKLKAYQPNLLILDEAHYLKHPTSQRSRMLLGKDGYARRMETVWALSGTPTPKNNPLEYWTILSTLFPEAALSRGLRTAMDFEKEYCISKIHIVRGHMETKVVGIANPEGLRTLFDETMLRRSVDELEFTMPPVMRQYVPLDLVDKMEEPEMPDEFPVVEMLVDPELARYRHNVGDAKVEPALAHIKDFLTGTDEKVVVFAHHRSVLRELREGLKDFGVVYIDGDTPPGERAAVVDVFQNGTEHRVFVGQTQACAIGITLTAASRVVLVEPDWTDAVNVQAAGRVARIGQAKDHCIVQYLVAAGTLDEGIIMSLAREARNGVTLYGA